jgi:hypothetical protein
VEGGYGTGWGSWGTPPGFGGEGVLMPTSPATVKWTVQVVGTAGSGGLASPRVGEIEIRPPPVILGSVHVSTP